MTLGAWARFAQQFRRLTQLATNPPPAFETPLALKAPLTLKGHITTVDEATAPLQAAIDQLSSAMANSANVAKQFSLALEDLGPAMADAALNLTDAGALQKYAGVLPYGGYHYSDVEVYGSGGNGGSAGLNGGGHGTLQVGGGGGGYFIVTSDNVKVEEMTAIEMEWARAAGWPPAPRPPEAAPTDDRWAPGGRAIRVRR